MRIVESQKRWKNIETFGRVCASDMDYHALPSTLPSHPWDDRDAKRNKTHATKQYKSEL